MKKICLFLSVACFITQAAAQGFWEKFKQSLPTVNVRVVSPLPLPRRTMKMAVANDVQSAPRGAAETTTDYKHDPQTAGENVQQDVQRDETGVIIVPPGIGRERAVPDFRGALVAVSFQSGRNLGLEGKIQEEFSRRGASFVQIPLEFSGDPCLVTGKPTICVVVSDAKSAGREYGNGSSSFYGRNSSYSSSSSDRSRIYYVAVSVVLVDGGKIQPLGITAKVFAAPEHLSGYSSDSSYGRHGGYHSSGGSSTNYDQEVIMRAMAGDAAKSAVGHLLKKKGDWQPGAAEAVRRAFGK